jgi:SAM-dependent methyltransferase
VSSHFARDARDVAAALRDGVCVDDRVFDDVFPLLVRARSSVYWTPVEVAIRTAKLLAWKPNATIVDVGSGIGKFCLIAAAVVEADVVGVEHRPHFVEIAEEAALKLGVRATFKSGTVADLLPGTIDSFYFFNPFAENFCVGRDRLDATVELCEERFRKDLEATQAMLSAAPSGARVVTFCGLGGDLPDSYEVALRERCGGGPLELWIKR